MKKQLITPTILVLAGIALCTNQSQAQKMYVDVNVGYNVPFAGESIINTNRYQNDINYSGSLTSENVSLSYGKGFNFGANLGFMFNKNVGVDLGLNYLIGSITTGENFKTYLGQDGTTGQTYEWSDNITSHMYSNMFFIKPAIIISSGLEKFTPYAKIGMEFGFGKAYMDYSNSVTHPIYYNSYNNKKEFSKGMAFGLFANLGSSYLLNDAFSVIGEINISTCSWAPKHSKYLEITRNGEDLLPTLSTYYKETNYSKKTTTNYPNPLDMDKPSEENQIQLPFSSVGFKIGLRYNL